MPRRCRRQAALVVVGALALMLAACGPSLPNSVVSGSSATVGWSHTLTSTNTASTAGATAGNHDVAALTRGHFAERAGGVLEIDEGFGTVEVVDREPFTVRYDLADPHWSDGIPVDAADLVLAWAAGSNAFAPAQVDAANTPAANGGADVPEDATWFDSVRSGLAQSEEMPRYDEFGRWIDVRYFQPVVDWRTALDVAVPAHVVGALAFDVSDPMEAKQAVITAIEERDDEALAAIARVWNTGFDLRGGDGHGIPPELLVSSGPYRVAQVDQSRPGAQRVNLVVNPEYTGSPTPEYERIELVQTPATDQLENLGDTVDVAQVAPTDENRERIRDLERRDYGVSYSHDGTLWVLVLRSGRGELASQEARVAFLRAVPRQEVGAAGAGPWATQLEETNALLFAPGTEAYDIAMEDAGFRERFARSVGEAAQAREAAGVVEGATVCVLYDTDVPFAGAAFDALRKGVAEAGWDVRDCGDDNVRTTAEHSNAWHAVLTRVPLPTDPAGIAAQWGTEGRSSLSGTGNQARDRLIEELARTDDQYMARDLRVQIEADIVKEAVALPLAMNQLVTIADRDVEGVQPRPGPLASLTSGVVDWSPVQE